VHGWGKYEVSSLGRVRLARATKRSAAGKIMPVTVGPNGYAYVNLCDCERRKYATVHTLVCRAFHGAPPSPLHEVAHDDGVRSNPRAANLSWKTRAGNAADRPRHGTDWNGEKHGGAKLTNAQADQIRAAYARRDQSRRFWGQRDLARAYGVSDATIQRVVRGLSYRSSGS
jgi:hypothetical protein